MKSKSTARSGKGEQRVALSLHALCTAVVCAPVAALPAHLWAQAPARPELSIELVDPKMLRVCADPHNMPFSTETGEGFENKLAELLAGAAGQGACLYLVSASAGICAQYAACLQMRRVDGCSAGRRYRASHQSVLPHGLRPGDQARQRSRRRGHAGRPTAEGETLRHRGRNTPGGLPRAQRPHGPMRSPTRS